MTYGYREGCHTESRGGGQSGDHATILCRWVQSRLVRGGRNNRGEGPNAIGSRDDALGWRLTETAAGSTPIGEGEQIKGELQWRFLGKKKRALSSSKHIIPKKQNPLTALL